MWRRPGAGNMLACTTTGILSEVYAALTWQQAQPPHDPEQAAEAVKLLVESPSMIKVLPNSQEAALRMLELAASPRLRATRESFSSCYRPRRCRYSSEVRNALTISAETKFPRNWLSLSSQNFHPRKSESGALSGSRRR